MIACERCMCVRCVYRENYTGKTSLDHMLAKSMSNGTENDEADSFMANKNVSSFHIMHSMFLSICLQNSQARSFHSADSFH